MVSELAPDPAAADAADRALLEALPGIVAVLGPDGAWRWVNAGVHLLLDHPVGFCPPEGLVALVHPDDAGLVRSAFDEVRSGHRHMTGRLTVRLCDAHAVPRWFELTAVDHRDDPAIRGIVVQGSDVDEHQRATEAMRAATARLTALLAHIDGGVLVVDDRQYVVFANDEFARLLGLGPTAHAVVGRPVSAITAAFRSLVADPYGFEARDLDVYSSGDRVRGELVELADGRTLERSYNPVQVGAVSYGHLWIYHDVTARLQAEADLAAARDAALAAMQLKAEFVATVSHELRTPLHGVLGLVELLADDVAAEQRPTVQRVHASLQSLRAIVDDILDFEKIEAGRLVIEHIEFDPLATIRAAVSVFEPLTESKGVELRVTAGPGVPATALGDPLRVSQLVSNLVSNAVKFTGAGAIEVAVGWDARRRVHIDVHDTGTGIAPDALERIFEPFAQADQSTVRRFGGTGLGLAICRRLAALMGGTLTATSEPGRGSCFSVVLPITPTQRSAAAPPAAEGPTRGTGTVLVAEDDDTARLLVERQLERLGYTPVCVADGRRALETFRAAAPGTFRAVVLDGQMPELDGPATATEIRAVEAARGGPRVAIVALTANARVSDREHFARCGADDFCAKPASLGQLAEVLARVAPGAPLGATGDVESDREAGHTPDTGSAAPPTVAAVAFDALDRLVDELGEREIVRHVVSGFLDRLPGRLDELHGAHDDAPALQRAAHQLRGAASTVGATDLAACARVIEEHAKAGELTAVEDALAAIAAAAATTADQLAAWCGVA